MAGHHREARRIAAPAGAEAERFFVRVPRGRVAETRFDAIESGLEHDIDDARERFPAVDRRRAGREHVDALDHRQRNSVQVEEPERRRDATDRLSAPAVDQNQRRAFACSAQAHGRRDERRLERVERHLRHRSQEVCDCALTARVDARAVVAADLLKRLLGRSREPRAGDNDRFHGFGRCARAARVRTLGDRLAESGARVDDRAHGSHAVAERTR